MKNVEFVKALVRVARSWEMEAFEDTSIGVSYLCDAKDLREIALLLARGEERKAQQKAYNLDTIVRDSIPDHVWEFLNRLDS